MSTTRQEEFAAQEAEQVVEPAGRSPRPAEADVERSIVLLIERGQRGQAIGLMMSAYGEAIGRFFARRVARQEWVDDLTQETFVRAMQGLSGFRGEARVKTWLTRIAYNVMCTAHNHRSRAQEGRARYHEHQQAS
ncbi:MAG: hypothetical protein CMH57_10500 [Myxococcales bacterium]|nr:hypothetical protein [Myxococcales bacterium]